MNKYHKYLQSHFQCRLQPLFQAGLSLIYLTSSNIFALINYTGFATWVSKKAEKESSCCWVVVLWLCESLSLWCEAIPLAFIQMVPSLPTRTPSTLTLSTALYPSLSALILFSSSHLSLSSQRSTSSTMTYFSS